MAEIDLPGLHVHAMWGYSLEDLADDPDLAAQLAGPSSVGIMSTQPIWRETFCGITPDVAVVDGNQVRFYIVAREYTVLQCTSSGFAFDMNYVGSLGDGYRIIGSSSYCVFLIHFFFCPCLYFCSSRCLLLPRSHSQ